jgi:gamma-glutamylcyclotransferase (GGCT)/AIG2-like uncharacterized protein YtfP
MAPPDPPYVFVYGTLLPGLAPPVISGVVDRCRVIGAATIEGRLYDLGAYPGCTIESGSGSVIHGQLLEIPDAPTLERLDWYECYAAHDDEGSLFRRTTCDATRADGSRVRAWVYVYNRDLAAARRIVSGRYERAT